MTQIQPISIKLILHRQRERWGGKNGKTREMSLTLDGRCPGTVVEDGQLPEHLSRTHGAQLHAFFCYFNLPIWKKKRRHVTLTLSHIISFAAVWLQAEKRRNYYYYYLKMHQWTCWNKVFPTVRCRKCSKICMLRIPSLKCFTDTFDVRLKDWWKVGMKSEV